MRDQIDLVTSPHKNKVVVADRGLLKLAKEKYLIVTDDYKLSSYCVKEGFSSINFNHLRYYVDY